MKALAQKHGPEAIQTLVAIMRNGESDTVKKAAAADLLDRGYGKAHQTSDIKVETTRYVVEGPPKAPDVESWVADLPVRH